MDLKLFEAFRLKLYELQLTQAARREKFHMQLELDELRAIVHLAHALYGDRGLVESGMEEPGWVYIGRYLNPYDPKRPKEVQLRRLVLKGNTLAELEEQAALLRSFRS